MTARRDFLRAATGTLAASTLAAFTPATEAAAQEPASGPAKPNQADYVDLPPIQATTEQPDHAPGPMLPRDRRVGFAIVGLGHLSLNQILPAFGASKYCKPAALVSGDPQKAAKVAAQYGIPERSIYSYANYEQLAQNPDVQVIYVVLPNSMHEEFVVRGAKTGKHILCEKPMATSVASCERMIAACRAANIKLMIAYRQQYEPHNRAIVEMVRANRLGKLRTFEASNTQNQGDPTQWRLKRKLAGGGCLPDVGVYCISAARFLTGEEPVEAFGQLFQPKDDPRFTEVEATCQFTLRFPSGLLAICNSGYSAHHSQFLRIEGSDAWAALDPAFGYHGLKLLTSRLDGKHEVQSQPSLPDKDQFALEMDHMALCVLDNLQPHTPGEEGLQDQRILEAIYESCRTGRTVKIQPPAGPTRGPDPAEDN